MQTEIRTLEDLIPTIRLISDIKAVLFDMDGTLIDTEPLHAKATTIFLRDYGIVLSETEAYKKIIGRPDSTVFQEMKNEYPELKHVDTNLFLNKKNEILICLHANSKLDERIMNALTVLRNSGKKLGLVTASEEIVARNTIAMFKLENLFDVIVSTKDVYLSKPNPAPYFLAMRKLSCQSSDVAIFEDSNTGLLAAQASGGVVYKAAWFNRT